MNETTNSVVNEVIEGILVETVEIVEVETYTPGGSNVDHMVETLPLMGKGMLGIFIVTVIIVACVAILNKTTNKQKDEQ